MNNQLILIKDLGMKYANESSKQKRRYGLYKCFCGNEFETLTSNIKKESTKSCGCSKIVHNMYNNPIYQVWNSMIDRCNNPKSNRYSDYGGRGITICDRWLDVKNFISDMYPTFIEGFTLDRIDVNGNYEPSNCRWATKEIQARNKRKYKTTNKYIGVTSNSNKYQARITINNIQIYIGSYKTELQAAKARDKYIIDNRLEHTRNFT